MTIPAPIPDKAESSLSFTQGLLLGQLSIVILIGAFIKFFIFGDPPSPDVSAALRATERRSRTLAHKRSLLTLRSSTPRHASQPLNRKRSSVLRNPAPLTTNAILSKTYYNVDSHQPESLDWFNVLIAQTIAQFRADAQHDDAILTSLTKALNGGSRPDFLDEIKVTELSLGEDFPIFSNCRVIPVDEDGMTLGREGGAAGREHGRLQARMDVDLSDFITLAVETKLLLNYPKPLVAVLPVALAVSVVRFSGTLSISFVPGSPLNGSPTTLAFCFLDDYRLDLSIRSLVGSRSRLQDVPKIAQLIEARLHTWFDERCHVAEEEEYEGGEDLDTGSDAGGIGRARSRDVERDLREEARKEVEAETGVRVGRSRLGVSLDVPDEGSENGLRFRRKSRGRDEYSMPGSMPGLSMT
ncbi:putative mitochondrial outer membrane protein mmm1 protein [Botrytis fragariae]|uniref:Maintenance of mitochondrial morphology protein 1 n=1 Tax=Botrytis fragariae TaxID=1964551 RepID=A0A8H6B5M4_9HELO|nr:putative mitochondrial outer membrane protein mmm1 protein [Botrytis fragariae]KAF5879432.1 putative mitochondrial outer membrane protein mmm1 protein [Botrytis fragariae]